MIKLQLIGNLGGDATTNIVNGKQVINFSACHTEKWKDASGAQKEKSLWVSCAWWNDSQNITQYLKKGQQVYVEGIPDVRIYLNARSESIAQITMRVTSLNLLGSVAKKEDSGAPTQSSRDDINNPTTSDDVPF
ncbi:MAG: single-stranded DNA-binding protein [Melioribacteraceae bacterium]